MSTEDRIWELFSLKLSGEATSLELEELNRLLHTHPELSLKAETLNKIWKAKITENSFSAKAFDKHLHRLSSHFTIPALQYEEPLEESTAVELVEERKPSFFRRPMFWLSTAAAAACLLFFLPIDIDGTKGLGATDPVAKTTVSTKPGMKSRMILPDGTIVMLNAGSYLTYDDNFSKKAIREVQLSGEAYFEVTKDPKHPFIIHTNSIDVKVLGTAFNVRSFPNENTTETSLVHGSVEISVHNNPDRKIILKPNEKLIVNNNITQTEVTKVARDKSKQEETMMTLTKMRFDSNDSISSETRWTQDKILFEATAFAEAIAELERMYNVRFVVKKDRLRKETITGEFENKSLTIVMEALRLSSRFDYEIKDGVVTIW